MSNPQTALIRPAGYTSGTSQRPAHELAAPALIFNLASELELLWKEECWQRSGHNAKTLFKEGDFRVVLITMKAGVQLPEHQTGGRVSLQCVAGHLRLHLPDGTTDLMAGQLLALSRAVPYDVESLDESAFLLTVAWPDAVRSE